MSNTLAELSNQLTTAVERASASVVAVHGRPRVPSSGIVWRPGLVITADAALRRDEDLRVTLPSGETVAATLSWAPTSKGPPGTGSQRLFPKRHP